MRTEWSLGPGWRRGIALAITIGAGIGMPFVLRSGWHDLNHDPPDYSMASGLYVWPILATAASIGLLWVCTRSARLVVGAAAIPAFFFASWLAMQAETYGPHISPLEPVFKAGAWTAGAALLAAAGVAFRRSGWNGAWHAAYTVSLAWLLSIGMAAFYHLGTLKDQAYSAYAANHTNSSPAVGPWLFVALLGAAAWRRA
jgi:hypothetical protein